jgi:hypothetical protein
MNKSRLDLVDNFATALDNDDFVRAINMLDQACLYETSSKQFEGADAVIASFREATEWAHENLDKIVYLHTVEPCSDCHVVIRFVDNVEHSGKSMQHTFLMHVRVGDNDRVVHLRLEDLPGEKQKVSDFLSAAGINR